VLVVVGEINEFFQGKSENGNNLKPKGNFQDREDFR